MKTVAKLIKGLGLLSVYLAHNMQKVAHNMQKVTHNMQKVTHNMQKVAHNMQCPYVLSISLYLYLTVILYVVNCLSYLYVGKIKYVSTKTNMTVIKIYVKVILTNYVSVLENKENVYHITM